MEATEFNRKSTETDLMKITSTKQRIAGPCEPHHTHSLTGMVVPAFLVTTPHHHQLSLNVPPQLLLSHATYHPLPIPQDSAHSTSTRHVSRITHHLRAPRYPVLAEDICRVDSQFGKWITRYDLEVDPYEG